MLHRRQVVLVEIRRLEDAPHHGRHTADRRHLLALDAAASRRRDRSDPAASARPWRPSRSSPSSSTGNPSRGTAARRAATPTAPRPVASRGGSAASRVATPSTMMFDRFAITCRCVSVAPFGFPVVPDVYMIASRSSSASGASSRSSADRRRDRRTGERRDARAHRPRRRRSTSPITNTCSTDGICSKPVGDHGEPARVADQHLRLGVVQAELELLGLPPRVQRHDDRAERGARPERDDPVGVVRRARARRDRRRRCRARPSAGAPCAPARRAPRT